MGAQRHLSSVRRLRIVAPEKLAAGRGNLPRQRLGRSESYSRSQDPDVAVRTFGESTALRYPTRLSLSGEFPWVFAEPWTAPPPGRLIPLMPLSAAAARLSIRGSRAMNNQLGQPRTSGESIRAPGDDEAESHGYEIPRSVRSARRPCGGGGRCSAPLAGYALLVAISTAAAGWNSWMATGSWAEMNRLRSRHCRLLAEGGVGVGRTSPRVDHDGCSVDVKKLLERASNLGKESAKNSTLSGSASVYRAVSRGEGSRNAELRPLAHLGSAYFPSLSPPPELRQVDRWNDDHRVGSITSGISSDAGGLAINITGYYYVYSQVGYVLSVRDVVVMSSATDHQLLRKFTDGSDHRDPEVLARAQRTRCWSSKSNCSMATSYMGAVFLLRKGEVVAVEVDSVKYIWHSPMQTYLGAYLVSSAS